MKPNSSLLFAGILSSLAVIGSSNAALTITLHPDGAGGTIVAIAGSGVTGATATSQLTNGITFGEQWLDMTGNPFSDTADPNNSVHMFTTPIPITGTVSITGIEVDNDPAGGDGITDENDDFRIFVDGVMGFSEPYSIDGNSTLTTFLPHNVLNLGTYTDDTDGGTTYLGGFSLVITDQPLPVPEPGSTLLVAAAGLLLVRRRR